MSVLYAYIWRINFEANELPPRSFGMLVCFDAIWVIGQSLRLQDDKLQYGCSQMIEK